VTSLRYSYETAQRKRFVGLIVLYRKIPVTFTFSGGIDHNMAQLSKNNNGNRKFPKIGADLTSYFIVRSIENWIQAVNKCTYYRCSGSWREKRTCIHARFRDRECDDKNNDEKLFRVLQSKHKLRNTVHYIFYYSIHVTYRKSTQRNAIRHTHRPSHLSSPVTYSTPPASLLIDLEARPLDH
jgi:hypothetical protein